MAMTEIKSKKVMTLPINLIIVLLIALVVFIFVYVFFTGQTGALTEIWSGFVQEATAVP